MEQNRKPYIESLIEEDCRRYLDAEDRSEIEKQRTNLAETIVLVLEEGTHQDRVTAIGSMFKTLEVKTERAKAEAAQYFNNSLYGK